MRRTSVHVLACLLAGTLALSADAATVAPGTEFSLNFDLDDGNGNLLIDPVGQRPSTPASAGLGDYGAGVPITDDFATGGFFLDRGFFDDTYGIGFRSRQGIGGPLTLFDANCDPAGVGVYPTCTGGDPDLGTGSYFGTDPQGLVLIAQETNGSNDNTDRISGTGTPAWWENPDDDATSGYDIIADFNTTDSTSGKPFYRHGVTLTELILIDQENTEDVTFLAEDIFGNQIDLSAVSTIETELTVGSPGGSANGADNDILKVSFSGFNQNLRSFEVVFLGSGALEVITWQASVPLPASAWMTLAGLGALGLVAHRRRRAA